MVNGGVIVVDGGTEGDATHLRDVIMSKGGHVNAWFIPHPHNDHAGALVQLITDGALMQGMAIDAVYYNIADQNFYNTYEPERAAFVQQFRNTMALLGAAAHTTHRNDFYQIDVNYNFFKQSNIYITFFNFYIFHFYIH